jgi:hypothetical protein
MLAARKKAFDTISRVFAITKLDIEHHQAINDQSLNIHGENYFKDVFNFVYKSSFENANSGDFNAPYIDLIDTNIKEIVQITTTRSKEKILHSLKALTQEKYNGYQISIYYLLSKAMPNSNTVKEIESEYNVKLKSILKDSTDLVRDIDLLTTPEIIELSSLHFEKKEEKYTDELVLDLVFNKLLKEKANSPPPSYDDDLGSIETDKKITINKLNSRISGCISRSLDYTCILSDIDDGELSSNLRDFVINELYRNILIDQLKSKQSKTILLTKNVNELQEIALDFMLDFNKSINSLHQKLESLITVKDFNSMDVAWILVAYFFEICHVGVRVNDIAN